MVLATVGAPMYKILIILIILLNVACSSNENASPSTSLHSQAIQRDCIRIVKSEIGNLYDQQNPTFQKFLASCNKGAGYYNNEYVACVQQSPYSNVLECAYKARGIDRSERDPSLKDMKVGQYGGYSAMIKDAAASTYKDLDPKLSIDRFTLKMYLEQRDKSREIAGLQKIEDNHSPIDTTFSSFDQDGKKYWVVRQTYQDLQIAKIMLEDSNGYESVICAQYGADQKLMLNSGLCAGLLKKHFKVSAPGS